MKEKCEFCKKEKETKTIHDLNDENPIRHQICKDCIKIEAPYLDWDKIINYNKQI